MWNDKEKHEPPVEADEAAWEAMIEEVYLIGEIACDRCESVAVNFYGLQSDGRRGRCAGCEWNKE